VSHTFNRYPEALATSKPTAQSRTRPFARTPHPGRVIADASNAKTLADRIGSYRGALTARQLSEILAISPILLYKMAKSGRIPSLRIGGCVRFCPRTTARWLRERGG
jgi:hypothetical protein